MPETGRLNSQAGRKNSKQRREWVEEAVSLCPWEFSLVLAPSLSSLRCLREEIGPAQILKVPRAGLGFQGSILSSCPDRRKTTHM